MVGGIQYADLNTQSWHHAANYRLLSLLTHDAVTILLCMSGGEGGYLKKNLTPRETHPEYHHLLGYDTV
jgi:hypothetical protein